MGANVDLKRASNWQNSRQPRYELDDFTTHTIRSGRRAPHDYAVALLCALCGVDNRRSGFHPSRTMMIHLLEKINTILTQCFTKYMYRKLVALRSQLLDCLVKHFNNSRVFHRPFASFLLKLLSDTLLCLRRNELI